MKFPSKSRKVLTRDDILNIKDLQVELVPAPEWGGDVYVRGMTGEEYGEYEAFLSKNVDEEKKTVNMVNVRAKLASLTICDKDGNRIFTEDDVKSLSGKCAAPLIRIFRVARKLSGLDNIDLELLTEGLKEDPFGDSASDSPDTSE